MYWKIITRGFDITISILIYTVMSSDNATIFLQIVENYCSLIGIDDTTFSILIYQYHIYLFFFFFLQMKENIGIFSIVCIRSPDREHTEKVPKTVLLKARMFWYQPQLTFINTMESCSPNAPNFHLVLYWGLNVPKPWKSKFMCDWYLEIVDQIMSRCC